MNGRIYDPKLGRMLSPDPVTQEPENGQNYNRYSYAYNNPLRYADPTGFFAAGSGCATTVASGGSEGGLACAGEIVIGSLLGGLFGGDDCDRVCQQRHAELALCNATTACAAEIGNIKEKFRRRRAGDIMCAINNGLSWEVVGRKTVRIGPALLAPALGDLIVTITVDTRGDILSIDAPLGPSTVVADSGGYGGLIETQDPITGEKIWVPPEMAIEILLGRAQGVDFKSPAAIDRYRAPSGCVFKEVMLGAVGAGILGKAQDEGLSVLEEQSSLKGYKGTAAGLGMLKTGANAAGILGALIDFNDSVRDAQIVCGH